MDNDDQLDILLRYLANRVSPNIREPRINFKKFADCAQTREQADFKSIEDGGELLLGSRASDKRKHYRELYNNYVKKVDRGKGKVLLNVPPDWSIDTYLEITEDLLSVLSSPYTPPVRNTSRSISPKRTTTNSHRRRLVSSLSPTPTYPRATISPSTTTNTLATMSKEKTAVDTKREQHVQRWVNAKMNTGVHAVDFSGAGSNKNFLAWEELETEVGTGPRKTYVSKGNILFYGGQHVEAAAASSARIANEGRSIVARRPPLDPLFFETFPNSGNSILGPAFVSANQGANKKRDTGLNIQLGSLMKGEDADFVEVDTNDVPFQEEEFLLPDGVIASNTRFNGTPVDASDLDLNIVPISNLHRKSPIEIIEKIKADAPSDMELDGKTDEAVIMNLYRDVVKYLFETMTTTKNGYLVHIQFEIVGENKPGFGKKQEKNLDDLMGAWAINSGADPPAGEEFTTNVPSGPQPRGIDPDSEESTKANASAAHANTNKDDTQKSRDTATSNVPSSPQPRGTKRSKPDDPISEEYVTEANSQANTTSEDDPQNAARDAAWPFHSAEEEWKSSMAKQQADEEAKAAAQAEAAAKAEDTPTAEAPSAAEHRAAEAHFDNIFDEASTPLKIPGVTDDEDDGEESAEGGQQQFQDPAFVNELLGSLPPGVNPNDPAIQEALRKANEDKKKKKKKGKKKPHGLDHRRSNKAESREDGSSKAKVNAADKSKEMRDRKKQDKINANRAKNLSETLDEGH